MFPSLQAATLQIVALLPPLGVVEEAAVVAWDSVATDTTVGVATVNPGNGRLFRSDRLKRAWDGIDNSGRRLMDVGF